MSGWLICLIVFTVYFSIGVLKLRFFDLNGEGGWIAMANDPHSNRCGTLPLWGCVFLCWLTWPIIFFSRYKYDRVDEEVFRWDKTANNHVLVKTGKKKNIIKQFPPIIVSRTFFHLQWAGAFSRLNKRKDHDA